MSLITTGVIGSYQGTVNEFKQIALDAIDKAEDALHDMDRTVDIGQGNANRGDREPLGVVYEKGIDGSIPKLSHTINIPNWPNYSLALNDVPGISIPEFTETAPGIPAITLPKAPTDDGSDIEEPGLSPVISDVEIPVPPTIDTITDPLKYAINLPDAPTIALSDFNIEAPTLGSIEKPQTDFNWEESEYTSDLLTQVVSRVDEMSRGGTGIPDVIWNAIWEKGSERESKAAIKAINDVNNQWASRGFSLPAGAQAAQILEMRQKLQDSAVSRARDIAIKQSELEIENMKFSVQQGIAMESLRGGWYQQMLNRTLDGYKYTYQLAIEVLNADIGLFNAEVQAYLGQAQVHKIIIESELAELEVYKTELEGQKLVNDINMQEVEIYKAKIQAATIKIDQYNSILQGIKTEVDVSRLQLETYSQEVNVYGERVKAIGLIYDNYKTAMTGAKIESDIYNTSVSAFSSKVGAYSSQVDAEVKRTSSEIDINKLILSEYTTKLDAHNQHIRAEIEQLKAYVVEFDADIKAYGMSSEEEKRRVDTELKGIAESTKWTSLKLQANINDADNYIKASMAEAGLAQRISQSIAEIEKGIAQAAMGTINTSSDISDTAENIQTL